MLKQLDQLPKQNNDLIKKDRGATHLLNQHESMDVLQWLCHIQKLDVLQFSDLFNKHGIDRSATIVELSAMTKPHLHIKSSTFDEFARALYGWICKIISDVI